MNTCHTQLKIYAVIAQWHSGMQSVRKNIKGCSLPSVFSLACSSCVTASDFYEYWGLNVSVDQRGCRQI